MMMRCLYEFIGIPGSQMSVLQPAWRYAREIVYDEVLLFLVNLIF